MKNAYAVIMAGGKGERLWPLSTPERPKQFLCLLGDQSMLQQTVARIRPLVPMDRVLVIAAAEHAALVRDQLPDLPEDNIISEPMGRGTAPCVGLSALIVHAREPKAVMVTLPADHVIADQERFRSLIEGAIEITAASSHLLTFGIPPDRPETGYGYIHAVEPWNGSGEPAELNAVRVERFTEKPDRETARRFLEEGTYFWNSGMFVWRVDTILEEIKRHMPDLYQSLSKLEAHLGKPEFEAALTETYAGINGQSIDRGVMEKSNRILLVTAPSIGWSDVGGWEALREVLAHRKKPWGYEHLWALNQHYAGKFLHIRAGESLSLQYHEMKDETIHVLEGKLRLRIGSSLPELETRDLLPGDSCPIPPGIIHQMEALETCVIAEVSTPHLADVVRLGDRYGRTGSCARIAEK